VNKLGVYIFGIEGVPLFEMLLIVSLLLLIGLILVLQEIRKLRKLLSEEGMDIRRFEADLARFERDEQRTSNAVVAHVQSGMAGGIPPHKIQQSLIRRGWSKEQVKDIFNKLSK
jgi:hypothetical protein